MAQKYSLPVIFCSLFATPDMISNVPLIMLSEAGAQWKVHQQKREKKGRREEGRGGAKEGRGQEGRRGDGTRGKEERRGREGNQSKTKKKMKTALKGNSSALSSS